MKKHLVAITTAFALLWVGCAKNKDAPTRNQRFPDEKRTEYLKSCEEGAQKLEKKAKPYCECTLKKIEQAYNLEEFMQVAEKIKIGEVPDKVMNIVKACL